MVRFSLILGGLLCTAVSAALLRPATPGLTDAQKHRVYRPYVAAATDCLARTILETPVALQRAREGAWMEAVRLTGHHCDPVVGRMIFAHAELFGSQTGRDLFQAADLSAALGRRLHVVPKDIAEGADPQARNQMAQVSPPLP